MESGEPRWVSDLMDLTGLGMRQVENIPEPHLLRSLRRLLQEAGTLSEQFVAWQNITAVSASSARGERTSAAPAHAHDNGDPGKV
jgi:FXSXX-COOH protein